MGSPSLKLNSPSQESLASRSPHDKQKGCKGSSDYSDRLMDLNASLVEYETTGSTFIGENNRVDNGDKDGDSGQSKFFTRGHRRPAADAKLKELVALYGPQNWNLIAEKLEGRSGKSCRLRWFNQLDPRINRRAFPEDEEERLMAAHRAYGSKSHHHQYMMSMFRENTRSFDSPAYTSTTTTPSNYIKKVLIMHSQLAPLLKQIAASKPKHHHSLYCS